MPKMRGEDGNGDEAQKSLGHNNKVLKLYLPECGHDDAEK